MIFPSTSSRLLGEIDMLIRNCSDISCRRRGLAMFFQTPHTCTRKSIHVYKQVRPKYTVYLYRQYLQQMCIYLLNTQKRRSFLWPKASMRVWRRNMAVCRYIITQSSGVISILIRHTSVQMLSSEVTCEKFSLLKNFSFLATFLRPPFSFSVLECFL